MEYIYKAQIVKIDPELNDQVVVQISSLSEEGLMEEMGKKKWTEAIKKSEEFNSPDYYDKF